MLDRLAVRLTNLTVDAHDLLHLVHGLDTVMLENPDLQAKNVLRKVLLPVNLSDVAIEFFLSHVAHLILNGQQLLTLVEPIVSEEELKQISHTIQLVLDFLELRHLLFERWLVDER